MTSGKQLSNITEDKNTQIANKTFQNGYKLKNLNVIGDSVSVNDAGTITMPTGVVGLLEVFTVAEYIKCHVEADGTITLIYKSANAAITDAASSLCVYDGGTGAIIKNNLGSTKTIRYTFYYS